MKLQIIFRFHMVSWFHIGFFVFVAIFGRQFFFPTNPKGHKRSDLCKIHDMDTKTIKRKLWAVVSNIFYVHPYLGKIPNLTNIFQMGWNHQLETPLRQFVFGFARSILFFSECILNIARKDYWTIFRSSHWMSLGEVSSMGTIVWWVISPL